MVRDVELFSVMITFSLQIAATYTSLWLPLSLYEVIHGNTVSTNSAAKDNGWTLLISVNSARIYI